MDSMQVRPSFKAPVENGTVEGMSDDEVRMFVRQARRPYEKHYLALMAGWAGAYDALCLIASAIDGGPTSARESVNVAAIIDGITKLQNRAQEVPPIPPCGSELETPGRAWVCNKHLQHISIGDKWHEDARGNRWSVASPAPNFNLVGVVTPDEQGGEQ